MDVVTEDDRSLQVHECNVSVHVLFPVVLGMDDDLIQQSNSLFIFFISEIVMKERTHCTVATESLLGFMMLSDALYPLRQYSPPFTMECSFRPSMVLPSLSL